jgi:CelD/BcsL family acetyltransferase involved in cellulose biosynthesis
VRTRETFQFFVQEGWLRIYILYVKNLPCAFLAGQLYNNNFYCQYAGYHPDYTHFSVGSVLTARVFEELAAAGVQHVDLGEGGQEHNRRIGCQMVEEGTVHVYSPSLRGVWLNLFFGTTQIIRRGGRRVRSTLRLNRLGMVWRQYLVGRRQIHHRSTSVSSARKSL